MQARNLAWEPWFFTLRSHLRTSSPCGTIIFISRLLIPAETRYWPTELELAGLVWVLRKIRHLVEATELPTIVYNDHGASLGIAKQTTLSTSSTDKLNIRLVRASNYIRWFQLNITHKPGKQHIVPDALVGIQVSCSDWGGMQEFASTAWGWMATHNMSLTLRIGAGETPK